MFRTHVYKQHAPAVINYRSVELQKEKSKVNYCYIIILQSKTRNQSQILAIDHRVEVSLATDKSLYILVCIFIFN
jgi:hypothetical protein